MCGTLLAASTSDVSDAERTTCGLEKAAGWEIHVLQAMAGAHVMCAALC